MKNLFTTSIAIAIFLTMSAQEIDLEESIPGPGFQNAAATAQPGSISGADVDLDGDTDILISGLNSESIRTTTLYLNGGTGNFSQVPGTPFVGVDLGDTEFADVDGDGDPDLLLTGRNSSPELFANLYLNDGNGNFSLLPNPELTPMQEGDVEFSDLDGDGDLDLLILGFENASDPERFTRMYTNNGAGIYSLVPGTPFPAIASGKIKAFDMDEDGDDDLIMAGTDVNGLPLTQLYDNDGLGNFSQVTGTPFIGVAFCDIAADDSDGDGDVDLLISGGGPSGSLQCDLYTNDGNGNFSLETATSFPANQFGSTDFADYDGDGDLDIHLSGAAAIDLNTIYRNDGANMFVEVDQLTPMMFSEALISDLDGDADLDVVMIGANFSGSDFFKTRTFLNNLCIGNSCQGCTDPTACNFDSSALSDDGSCDFSCLSGCTYPQALNFNPNALFDDGSCTFEGVFCGEGTSWDSTLGTCVCDVTATCIADIDVSGSVGTGDLLMLLAVFGQSCL